MGGSDSKIQSKTTETRTDGEYTIIKTVTKYLNGDEEITETRMPTSKEKEGFEFNSTTVVTIIGIILAVLIAAFVIFSYFMQTRTTKGGYYDYQ